MLKPAQLYKKELLEKNMRAWYQPENIYWNGGPGDYGIDLPDNNYNRHCFVSVDSNNEVIGYISYSVDWEIMSVDGMAVISYSKGNLVFIRDLYKAIRDLFEVYHMNRVSWACYADNPALRGYRNFIKRYGGKECGYYRQIARLQDGKLHDSVVFEILESEFLKRDNPDRICVGDEVIVISHPGAGRKGIVKKLDTNVQAGETFAVVEIRGDEYCFNEMDLERLGFLGDKGRHRRKY